MKLINLIVFSCLLAWQQQVYAQSNDCQTLMYDLYRSNKPEKGKVFYTQYDLRLINASGKIEQESKVEMYLTHQQRQIITDAVHLYTDSVYVITIIPAAKTIAVNYMDEKSRAEYKKIAIGSADSVFFNSMQQESCNDITGNTKYTKEIVYIAKYKSSGTPKVKYLVNEPLKMIFKMIAYGPDLKSRMEYTYNVLDLDYKNKNISDKSVLYMAFNKDGSLLPQYKGYQVNDNRITTSKKIKQ